MATPWPTIGPTTPLIVSSRENFLICIDYETDAIRWILGDPTKKWYQFPSLRKFALTLPPGSLPRSANTLSPVTYDQNILVFDNGQYSGFQVPRGEERDYSSPRKYKLDLNAKTATEVWNFELGQSLWCPFCGGVYEDAPLNYVIDFTFIDGVQTQSRAQLIGLNVGRSDDLSLPGLSLPGCRGPLTQFRFIWKGPKFPTVGPQALNLSTRGLVGIGDNVLIGGFIVTGTEPKPIVLRALGPSISGFGLSDVLRDPVLSVYDSSGNLVGTNDNWQSDVNHFVVEANGLAPANPLEAAQVRTLAPGAYTVEPPERTRPRGLAWWKCTISMR